MRRRALRMWQRYDPLTGQPWGRRQAAQMPSLRQQWRAVARIRERAGDREGAARARRSAALSGPVKMMGGTIFGIRHREDPLRNYVTHLRRVGMVAACGSAGARKFTSVPGVADCGNCKRTRVWKGLQDAS